MVFLKSLLAALSTYSVIPVPQLAWNEEDTKYALCCFPAVGLVCGGALWGWYALCRALDAGGVLFAAVAACLPLLLTGGIHMDGYMDTVDAISSHQTRERKLEIMKDPNCGAFAVIFCGVWLLLEFGLFHELYRNRLVPVACPGYVLSRALSALCAATLPDARRGGMLSAYAGRARRAGARAAMAAVSALSCAGMLLLAPLPGALAAALAGLSALGCRALALRQFGGATGDTAGFLLQICELALLLGAWTGGLLP